MPPAVFVSPGEGLDLGGAGDGGGGQAGEWCGGRVGVKRGMWGWGKVGEGVLGGKGRVGGNVGRWWKVVCG